MRQVLPTAPLFAAALMTLGCRASTGATPALPCAGHVCAISVQNDAAMFLAVRYVDTTGRATVLGLVNPAAIRVFRVQWVRSATIRVIAEVRGSGTFAADVVLLSTRTNELHFPDDFDPVDDLAPRAEPPAAAQGPLAR